MGATSVIQTFQLSELLWSQQVRITDFRDEIVGAYSSESKDQYRSKARNR